MPRLLLPVLGLLAQSAAAQPLPQRFQIDDAHSSIGFAVRFMGLSTVRGAFREYNGTIMYSPQSPERSSVSVVIWTRSVNTNNEERDRHLQSPDFFDAAKYPTITFRSTSVRKSPGGFAAVGDLSIHGVNKRVTLPIKLLNAPTLDAWKNSRATFESTLRVSRRAFGILGTAFWNSEFDPGRMAISDDVDIELLISATIPNVDLWAHPKGDSLLEAIDSQGIEATMAQFRQARTDSIPGFALLVAGEKLVQRGRINDAIAFYETMNAVRPRSPVLPARLGEAYVKAGQLATARVQFEIAASRDATNTLAMEWLRVLPP